MSIWEAEGGSYMWNSVGIPPTFLDPLPLPPCLLPSGSYNVFFGSKKGTTHHSTIPPIIGGATARELFEYSRHTPDILVPLPPAPLPPFSKRENCLLNFVHTSGAPFTQRFHCYSHLPRTVRYPDRPGGFTMDAVYQSFQGYRRRYLLFQFFPSSYGPHLMVYTYNDGGNSFYNAR